MLNFSNGWVFRNSGYAYERLRALYLLSSLPTSIEGKSSSTVPNKTIIFAGLKDNARDLVCNKTWSWRSRKKTSAIESLPVSSLEIIESGRFMRHFQARPPTFAEISTERHAIFSGDAQVRFQRKHVDISWETAVVWLTWRGWPPGLNLIPHAR